MGVSTMPIGNMADNGLVDSSGRFELRSLNGNGLFRIIGTASAVKSVTLEGEEITDTPYEFKPGSNVAGLEIALTNSLTTLTGSVRTPRGEALKDYVVVIFPSNLRDGDNPGRFTRAARPDQSGKYVTRGLPGRRVLRSRSRSARSGRTVGSSVSATDQAAREDVQAHRGPVSGTRFAASGHEPVTFAVLTRIE